VPIFLNGAEPVAYFTLRLPPISLLALQGRARFGQGGVSHLIDRLGRLHADRSWLNLDLEAHGIRSEAFRGRRYVFERDPGANLLLASALDEPRDELALTFAAQSIRRAAAASR